MATVPHLCHPRQSAAANAQPNARDTRALGPAAAQALQTTLLVIFVLLPLLVPLWALFSFVVVPIAARGLRNTDSRYKQVAVGPQLVVVPLLDRSLVDYCRQSHWRSSIC